MRLTETARVTAELAGRTRWPLRRSCVTRVEELCQVLESGLDRPVIDDTGLTGRYVLKMHTGVVDTRDFLRVLCDKLGLTATSERRDVPVLVVRQR
ncbi:MAG: hypothetical protein DMF96_28650 [Acidobacteria bacterium]|nr:MAG: hypothetical protein DMF96_28650 [Acidobacteriota bacterium]